MSQASDIMAEMLDVQDLMKTGASDAVKEASVKTLASKIRALDGEFTTKTALKLCSAKDASTLPPEYKLLIQTSIDDRLLAQTSPSAKGKDKAPQQLLVHILAYLTAEDWGLLELPGATPTQMLQTIGNRYAKLGIRHLDEQTTKWVGTLVLHQIKAQQFGAMPRYHDIFGWVLEFKEMIARVAKDPWLHAVIVTYPCAPMDLPLDVTQGAYSAEDPPVAKAIPGFQALSAHVPLRSDNKLLVREKAMVQACQSMGFQVSAPQYAHMTPLQARHALAAQHQQRQMDPIPDMQCYPGAAASRGAAQGVMPSEASMVHQGGMPSQLGPDQGIMVPYQGMQVPSMQASSALARFVDASQYDQHLQQQTEQAATRPSRPVFKFGAQKATPCTEAPPDAGKVADADSMKYDDAALEQLQARPVSKRPAKKTEEAGEDLEVSDEDEDEGEEEGEEEDEEEDEDEDEDGDEEEDDDEGEVMKKPSTPKGKDCLKRPAVPDKKESMILKRPASEMAMKVAKAMNLDVTVTNDDLSATTMKNLASRWYHRVLDGLIKKGVSKERAKEAARKAHAKSNELWKAMEAKQSKVAKKGKKA